MILGKRRGVFYLDVNLSLFLLKRNMFLFNNFVFSNQNVLFYIDKKGTGLRKANNLFMVDTWVSGDYTNSLIYKRLKCFPSLIISLTAYLPRLDLILVETKRTGVVGIFLADAGADINNLDYYLFLLNNRITVRTFIFH